MADENDNTQVQSEGQTRARDSRQDRLKLALRENLKRRKTQARERGKMTDASAADDKACLNGELGKRAD